MKAFRGQKGFWERVEKTETCWLWTGAVDGGGYGKREHLGKTCAAHRLSWLWTNGPIPPGLFVLHHCDVRRCVNPAHLFLGTNVDNSNDKISKLRHSYGSKAKGSILTEEDVLEMRRRHATGERKSVLAKEFGVGVTTAYYAIRGTNWKHVPGAGTQ